jgi:hypothetical protein
MDPGISQGEVMLQLLHQRPRPACMFHQGASGDTAGGCLANGWGSGEVLLTHAGSI